MIQKTKNKRTFWVHQNPPDADSCITFLDDENGTPALPLPTKEAKCPACSETLIQRSGKYGPYWTHKNRDAGCEHRSLDDKDGVPQIKPPKAPEETSTCLSCGGLLVRRYSTKTTQHFWVHKAKRPKCDLKFIDDANGVPGFPASVTG